MSDLIREHRLSSRAIPSPQTMREEDMSIDVTMSTEGQVRVVDWMEMEEIDEVLMADGMCLPDGREQIPLLDAHSRASAFKVLGAVRDVRVEGATVVGRAYFDAKDPAARKVWEKIRGGFLTDVSVGYRVMNWVRAEKGKEANLNGKKYCASEERALRVVSSWRLHELSMVPIGADRGATVRADAEPQRIATPEPSGNGVTTTSDLERQMDKDTTKTDVPAAKSAEEQARAAADLEKEIAKRVAEGVAKAQADAEALRAGIEEELTGVNLPEDAVKTVRAAKTVDEARKLCLAAIRASRSDAVPMIRVGKAGSLEDHLRAIECGALMGRGYDDWAAKQYPEHVVDLSKGYRNIGPLGICRAMLSLAGKPVPYGNLDVVREAFDLCKRSASTFSLANTLGAVANKALLQGYTEQPGTWEQWCSTGEVPDYKLNTGVRMTMGDNLQEIGPSGEIPHTTASEETQTYAAKLYAQAFNIAEQQIVNDDQGVFSSVPRQHGAAAKRHIAKSVYEALLGNGTLGDGYALCGTLRKVGNVNQFNMVTGTTTTMDTNNIVTSLDQAMALFLKICDAGGSPIDVQPKFLLVPPEVAAVAESVLMPQPMFLNNGNTLATPAGNRYAGRFQSLVESRLSNANYSGSNSQGGYLVADPAQLETLRVVFLRGQREPRVEQTTEDFSTFGIKSRVSLRYGVGKMDWRGIVRIVGR